MICGRRSRTWPRAVWRSQSRLAEIAKLKTSNMGEEDTIKKAYLELGRLYYAERGAAPEGAYAAACGRISQA